MYVLIDDRVIVANGFESGFEREGISLTGMQPGHEQGAGLKHRFAKQHARRDRRARIMPFVEILIGAPGTAGHKSLSFMGDDFVHEEKWRPMRDELLDFVHGYNFK